MECHGPAINVRVGANFVGEEAQFLEPNFRASARRVEVMCVLVAENGRKE